MSRPTDWSPLLISSDPVPGDPTIVSAFATRYSDVADAIKLAATKLNAIADHHDDEISKYVDTFRDKAKEVASDISRAHERYSGVAKAMRDYASPLERAQSMADAALTKARGAADAVSHNTTLHNHYETELQAPGISDEDKTRYTQLQQQAHQDLTDGQTTLHQAQQDLQAAITLRNGAAGTAADAIKDVDSSGKLNDSGWTKFWEHNGGWIGTVVQIIGDVAAVLAIVAILIPGLGEIVLAVIAIVSIISAALIVINAICQMTAGTKSLAAGLFEIGMAVIPFGAGKVLGHFAGAGGEALEGAAATTLRTSKAAQGIRGVTQAKALDKVTSDLAGVKPALADRILIGSKDALKIARINALGGLELTAAGTSTRIAGAAESQLWKYTYLPGIEPVLNASQTEAFVGGKIEQANEPKEMQDAGGR